MATSSRRALCALAVCVALACAPPPAAAFYSVGFMSFLTANYGARLATTLNRADIGFRGSFGGGASSSHLALGSDPIIMMHGLTQSAGDMRPLRDYFISRGYNSSQLFATSYGPKYRNILLQDTSTCEDYKAVRTLIQAVAKYTGRKVQITGCSMGSPTSRKAILGGKCEDTGENLGAPITELVSAFVSQAGSNYGAIFCELLVGTPICNAKTGLAFRAKWLDDVNAQSGYEAERRYMIRSKTDEVVGYEHDGIFPAQLPAANINVTLNVFEHISLCVDTKHIQYALLTRGTVTQAEVLADTLAIGGQVQGAQRDALASILIGNSSLLIGDLAEIVEDRL